MSSRSVSPSREESPFALLGLEPAFDLDVTALERTHRELSRALHPDRYVGAPPGERRQALDRAVLVNQAFRVVRDPLSRAEALFALRGVPLGDGHEPKPSQAFLMDVLEWREELGDAKAGRDAARVAALGAVAREGTARVLRALASAFEADADLHSGVALLGELRFFRRFADEVSAAEDDLLDAP
ncbi:MAG TPA: Fe-S protein assembly co-chaperone HscB [Polyangiaceae bacterium]|nr:Fe-S protein assembly co-chaperone HscB [Polyangiaceae bacterium]